MTEPHLLAVSNAVVAMKSTNYEVISNRLLNTWSYFDKSVIELIQVGIIKIVGATMVAVTASWIAPTASAVKETDKKH